MGQKEGWQAGVLPKRRRTGELAHRWCSPFVKGEKKRTTRKRNHAKTCEEDWQYFGRSTEKKCLGGKKKEDLNVEALRVGEKADLTAGMVCNAHNNGPTLRRGWGKHCGLGKIRKDKAKESRATAGANGVS